MRILVISDRLPYPPMGGTELRLDGLLRPIAAQHEIWYAGFLDRPEKAVGLPRMAELCGRMETAPLPRRARAAYVPELASFALRAKPPELAFYHSRELAEKVQRMLDSAEIDVVEIVGTNMALYLEQVPQELRPRSLLTFIDVQFEKADRIRRITPGSARRVRAWLHSRMMRQWEPRYAARFGRCVAMSEVDRQLLLAANSRLRVSVIPNGVDARAKQPLPPNGPEHSLLFLGNMSYPPNADAALYFCRAILPLIRARIPDVELAIVGSHPPQQIAELGKLPNVLVTGFVPDVIPYYQRSRASVVPLRAGGGTRLKILESMALGRPVVTTALGCEGLQVVDGEHLLIADEPAQYADQVIRLFEDKDLYEMIARQARRLVEAQYDWSVIARELLAVYEELADRERGGRDQCACHPQPLQHAYPGSP